MSNRKIAYILILAGVVLQLACLFVDAVGIGTEGFGIAQILGLIVGVVLEGVGVYRIVILKPPA